MNLYDNIADDLFNNKIMSNLHLRTYCDVYRNFKHLLQHLKK